MAILIAGLYLLGSIAFLVFYFIFAYQMYRHAGENPDLSDFGKTAFKAWIFVFGFLIYALFVVRDSFIRFLAICFIVYTLALIAVYPSVQRVMDKQTERLRGEIDDEIKNPKWMKDQVRFSVRPSSNSVSAGMPVELVWQVMVGMKGTIAANVEFEGFKEPPSFGPLSHEEILTNDTSEEESNIGGNVLKRKVLTKFKVTSKKPGHFKIKPGVVRLRLTYSDSTESYPLELTAKPVELEFR